MAKNIKKIKGIEGLVLIKPHYFMDQRGYTAEIYNDETLKEAGICDVFVQDTEALTHKGVIRGFHVNTVSPQAKLIRVVKGEVFDVVIDLRKNSPTYKSVHTEYLSKKNRKQLYIPAGFAHAYLALKDSIVTFKTTGHYIPGEETAFSYKSREFGIKWPLPEEIISLYSNGQKAPDFSEIEEDLA